MRLHVNSTVLGYRPGDPDFEVDETDADELAIVGPYITGGHLTVVDTDDAEATPEDAVAALKGDALDQALRDAGLPLTGKAADKRSRLLEHLTPDPEVDADQGDGTEGDDAAE